MAANEGDVKKSAGNGSGCLHLDPSASNLKRYAIGLKWGKKIKRGEVKRDDDDEEEDEENKYSVYADSKNDAKRRKVC